MEVGGRRGCEGVQGREYEAVERGGYDRRHDRTNIKVSTGGQHELLESYNSYDCGDYPGKPPPASLTELMVMKV